MAIIKYNGGQKEKFCPPIYEFLSVMQKDYAVWYHFCISIYKTKLYMAKFTNEQLAAMAHPASVTEEQKLENAENAVKNALSNYTLASGDYEVFGQGSYANNTNIRNNSDIDINVCYTGGFYFHLPSGRTRE